MVFSSADGAFSVLRVATPTGEVVVVGSLGALSDHDPTRPAFAAFEGRWEQHATHGLRFKADSFLLNAPQTREGLRLYLESAQVKGIGPTLARRLVDTFGDELIHVLEREPERLAEVHGISEVRARDIGDAWAEDAEGRGVTILLRGLGVTAGRIARIRRRYGDKAFHVVRTDPYRLASEVPGIGFVLADRIARAQGVSEDAPERVRAAARHVVRRSEDDGDCWLPRDELAGRVQRLGVPTVGLDEQVEGLVSEAKLEEVAGGAGVADPVLAEAEQRVVGQLVYRHDLPVRDIDVDAALTRAGRALGITLDPSQEAALRRLVRAPVAILTGGPGTGKTTLLRALLIVWADHGIEASLAAPTGRAARRLAEATGREAVTLHRLLEANPAEGGFQRHADRLLELDGLVVDESSMVDVRLMAALLDAMPTEGNPPLVLVGDADQLPSVGPGQVLRDLVASGCVPVARLTTVHRQAAQSGIVQAARRIGAGEVPVSGEVSGAKDFFVVERPDPAQAQQTLVEVVAERLPAKGLDPFRDVVVLTPTRKGPLGTQELNDRLRRALHPRAAQHKARLLEGDKVHCVRNRYDLDVYNGDMGRVEEVGRQVVRIRFDDRVVDWPREDLDQIELAYAVTVHKSQGSEYPAVVLALHRSHGIMLRRTLVYTAVTRARDFFCLVGERSALARSAATPDDGRRTNLVPLLRARLGEVVQTHDDESEGGSIS